MRSSTCSPPCVVSVSVSVGSPRRHFPVDPLLQLYDQSPDDREHDQTRKDFFGFHYLPGLDEQKAHPALAGTTDHFGRHDENNSNSHAEVKPSENARDCGRDNHLQLNLTPTSPEVLSRLDQP